MVIADLGLVGSLTAKAAGTSLVVQASVTIPVGTLVHACCAFDNIASVTAPTVTCAASGGDAPVANHATPIGSGVTTTAGSGVWHQCFRWVTTISYAPGQNICNIQSNQSAVARAAHIEGWSGVTSTLRGTVATATSATGAPSVATAGTALAAGDLVIGSVSFENSAQMTGDADTLNGTWDAIVGTFTTGGNAQTNVGTGSQDKTVTATGAQTFNPTGGVGDTVACVYSLVPLPEPTVTQASYRFYADGSESASVALAAQDTAYAADLSAGDANLLLRTRLQSTNTGFLPGTDDYQLQYEKNANGTWVSVPPSGVVAVTGYSSPILTNGEATTNRLTGGTGTFQAGKVYESGTVSDLGWTANNYTELLYALTLKQAALANGDTLRFRVLRNGVTTGLTYTQVPTIPVTITAPTRTGRPKVWDGSAFTNKPAKVWTGSAWVEKPVKVWSGSAWVLAK